MNFRKQSAVFFATGGYTGYIPFAPGTFGTIPGLFLCFLLSKIQFLPALLITVLFIAFAVWTSHEAEQVFGKKDPGSIVIDEMAGILVTLLGFPFTWPVVLSGFIVFRVLDILKPFPIRYLDRKLTGGFGIVIDDVVAGIIGNLLLRVVWPFAEIILEQATNV